MPVGAVFFATVIASAASTLLMGLYARLPFALAPGLESNGFMAFVVVGSLAFTWQQALGLVFWSGVLCVIFTVVPWRQKIIGAIPEGLKTAISTTVGVFVAVIGFFVTDLVKFQNGLPVGLGDFGNPKAILLYVGFAVAFLLGLKVLRFPAGMFVSLIVCTVLAKIIGIHSDTPPAESSDFLAALGELELFSMFSDPRAWTVLLVFFMIDFYGSIGKFIGLTRQTELQSNGEVRGIGGAMGVDAVGTIGGAWLGTSTIITYVESAVAIGQGGRTGVVAVVCAFLMLLSLFATPLIGFVPTAAAAGVLVYVGWLLLPRQEVIDAMNGTRDKDGSLDGFDFTAVIIMGLIALVTFSLDKSMLFGFAMYAVRDFFKNRTKANPFLYGSAIVLGIAMYFQYFVIVAK
jgi:AGZA family xanthine/uracil permease-like MFS transporter